MSFKSVFRSLQEVFPQVDLRILKAVAIEHSKDVDAAVEFILFEVLPSISEPAEASDTLHDTQETEFSSSEGLKSVGCTSVPSEDHTDATHFGSPCTEEAVGDGSHAGYVDRPNETIFSAFGEVNASLLAERVPAAHQSAHDADHAFHFMSPCLDEIAANNPVSNVHGGNAIDESFPKAEPELIPLVDHVVNAIDESFPKAEPELIPLVDHVVQSCQGSSAARKSSEYEYGSTSEDGSLALHANIRELYGIEANGTVSVQSTSFLNFPSSNIEKNPVWGCGIVAENDINSSNSDYEQQSKCSVQPANVQDLNGLEANDTFSPSFTSAQNFPSAVLEKSTDVMECGDLVNNDIKNCITETENQSSYIVENGAEQLVFEAEMVSVDDSYQSTLSANRSGQFISTDYLEDFVTDAKSNKKTLALAMESMINMIKEVELHEEKAKQAKEEASVAGQDILSKVDDLRDMLKNAKEANDMHAGEVYGEKAILATEARELQSRLLRLSNERDKSLCTIEEIRQTLKVRLAAAEEERAEAEKEKLEKERLAQEALTEQEEIMENIVQESKRLQEEAEENAKLREFLMDRGRIVDALQGEIAVICEDVMSLKVRVDERVPHNMSLPSASSSFSSSSSLSCHKSTSSDRVLHPVELKESPRIISQDLSKSQQLESITSCEKEINIGDNHKVSSDDEWELCDD